MNLLAELRSKIAGNRERPPRESSTGIAHCRVFAIGDIHGRLDLLENMIALIEERCRLDAEGPIVIFLGDYVDRGPDSAQVIDRLMNLPPTWRARFIGGNHEEAMEHFLATPNEGRAWLDFGGRETAASYGCVAPERDASNAEWFAFHEALLRAVPERHRRFLWGLEGHVALGDFLFVHAGVDPDKPLSSQSPHDLRWIRGKFLQNRRWLGKVIVHGHTPSRAPHSDDIRIGIDTWGYKTGRLTALELKGAERSFLQTEAPEAAGQ